MLSTERRRHNVHVLSWDVSYDVRSAHLRVDNKIKKKNNILFFYNYTK